MPKREPGLDLVRCIAFLFVVTFHSFLNQGRESGYKIKLSWITTSAAWLSVGSLHINTHSPFCIWRCAVILHMLDTVIGVSRDLLWLH